MSRRRQHNKRTPKRKPTRSCGKRRFRDPAEAKAALRHLRRHGLVRWYRCKRCKGIHLTSEPRNGSVAADKVQP